MRLRWWLLVLLGSVLLIAGCAAADKAADTIDKGSQAGLTLLTTTGLSNATPWLTTILGGLTTFAGFYKKYRAKKEVTSIIQGIEDVKTQLPIILAEFKDGKPDIEKITAMVNGLLKLRQDAMGVYPEVRADVKKVKSLLGKS